MSNAVEETDPVGGYLRDFGTRPRQVLLGADWIRSDDFGTYESHDNRYISVEACRDAAARADPEVVECYYRAVKGDPLYSGVVAWVMRRK